MLIAKVTEAMNEQIDDSVSFIFHSQSAIKGQTDYRGINIKYRAGLLDIHKHIEQAQLIDIDIGMGDKIMPQLNPSPSSL